MPTTWEQMFDTGRDASVATEAEEEERRGLFSRMRESLSKSRKAMTQQLTAVMFDPADADVWERLEEALIYADCGVTATAHSATCRWPRCWQTSWPTLPRARG